MIRTLVIAWAASLTLAGCFAEVRLRRLSAELENAAHRGRTDQYDAIERRITVLAESTFADDPGRALEIRTQMAESQAAWGNTLRALQLARNTVADVERIHGTDPDFLVPALLSLASIEKRAGRWSALRESLARISTICAPAYAARSSDIDPHGTCFHGTRYVLAQLYRAAGDEKRWALEYLRSDAFYGPLRNRDGGISALTVLARGYADYGAYPEAIWYAQRCIDELRPRYVTAIEAPPKPRRLVQDVELIAVDGAHAFDSVAPRCLEDLIDLRRRTGDTRAANDLEQWQKQLWANAPDRTEHLAESIRVADHNWHSAVRTSGRANDLAYYLAAKGRFEESIHSYREAIRWIDAAREREDRFADLVPPDLLVDELLGLARACEEVGRWADAEAAYARAGKIASSRFHPRLRWRLDSLAGQARSATAARTSVDSPSRDLSLANDRRANALWLRYLEEAEDIRGCDHPDFALGLDGLAETLERLQRHAEAQSARARAARLRAAYRRRITSTTDLPLPASLNSPHSPANH